MPDVNPSILRCTPLRPLPVILLLAGLLSACSTVLSNVEVFQELPANYEGAGIVILAGDERKTDSLEFRSYAKKLEARLNDAGFEVVEGSAGPRFAAFLDYAVGQGEQITSSYSIPQFGITGYSSSQTYGMLNTYGNSSTYSGTTTYNPTYGVTGYATGITTDVVYPRTIVIDIYEVNWADIDSSPQVYNLVISSTGECGNLNQVIDEMLEAGFQQFPAESGSAQRIELPAELDC